MENKIFIHKTAKVPTKNIGNNETIKCGYKKHSQSLSHFLKFCYSKRIGQMRPVDKLFKNGKNLFVSKKTQITLQ